MEAAVHVDDLAGAVRERPLHERDDRISHVGRRDLLEATEESWDQVLGVNLKGPYFLSQRVALEMVRLRASMPDYQPTLVNISSLSAYTLSTQRGDYCISKAGLSMAAALWSARLAEFDIPVIEIRPGIIATDMTAGVKAKYDALIEEGLDRKSVV